MSDNQDQNPRAAPTVCPYCGVGCTIEYAGNGKATGTAGPVNTSGEVCPKGVAAFDMVAHEDRLTEPLVREGGRFVTAPWETALTRVADALGEIIDHHGPDAVEFFASSNCTNEENYVFQKLARMLGTNNVDNCARLCHSSTVAAMSERLGAGAMTNTLDDLSETDCLLVTGANPAEQHPVIFRSYVLPAIRNGATLIHIDPRETDTTDAADIHLDVRPGYDIQLLNSMAKVVLDEGLADESFIGERTTGGAELKAHLRDLDVVAGADVAGVDADAVREAARAYAKADRAAIVTGMGMSQHTSGTDNVHALLNLALLTGNVGRPGTGVNPLRGQNNVQGAGDVGALPNVLPGYQSVTNPDARQRIADEWGVAPPSEPGLTETTAIHQFGDGVRAAVVFGENPAVTEPNANSARSAFDELDFCVVIDLFETATVDHADVVLPGSSWAEKSGTVTNTDRRVMRMRPNADLPGNARRDLDILTDIGQRLVDQADAFDYDGPEAVFEELARVNPLYAGMSYDGIGDGYQRWPFPADADSGTDVLHSETFASGERTAPLLPISPTPPADAVSGDQLVLTTGRALQHFNSGALTRRSETLMRMRGEDVLEIHPDDAAARDIADGDTVVVESDRGSVTVSAAVTTTIRPGVVFCTFHYQDPLANALTGDALDPVAEIPEYKHSAVTVRTAPAPTQE
ncbi:formate dehydrogenase subunit alpha [Haloarcula sp. S1AR25-5A]|uniref:Formate dehydrogenase subunit alpha n=1 Tax=Haloarcula terrestris TaxID=2950533 RepID=A0AAE4F3B9_9EURY|nr:formate dehydrogenase subunit alpha [Haloarcula terrestris]MDS0223531.1 formate dehydrogenase subunit alpha [Haloarcula terrestris]